MVRIGGFLGEGVEAGAGDAVLAQRREQRRLVDQPAAGGVDDDGIGLHQRQTLGIDQVAGLGRQRAVQADDVALRQQGVQIGDPRHALGLEQRVGREGVIGDDIDAEGFGKARGLLRDGAEGHQAHGRAGQFASQEAGLFPAAFAQAAVQRQDLLGHREEQRHGMFRHRDRIGAGRHHHGNIAGTGGREIDVVDADPVFRDHSQLRRMREQRLVDAAHADQDADGLGFGRDLQQTLALGIGRQVDRVVTGVLQHGIGLGRKARPGDQDIFAHLPHSPTASEWRQFIRVAMLNESG